MKRKGELPARLSAYGAERPDVHDLETCLFGMLVSSHFVNSSKVRFPAIHVSRFWTASYCHSLNLSLLRLPAWTLAK